MIDLDVVALSRLQFALTALYHFLFVPLTLGLSMLLAVMESVYVMTGREIWKQMTKFWGVLFGINFAMGVATGITMEFHRDAGRNAHRKIDAEQHAPKLGHLLPNLAAGHDVDRLHDSQQHGQAERQRHEQEMIERGKGELQSRESNDVQINHAPPPLKKRNQSRINPNSFATRTQVILTLRSRRQSSI